MPRAADRGAKRVREEEPSRERILATAAQLFARYGAAGMSLQMLADQVGLHKSTLFHHFSGKDDLVVQMLHEELGRIADVLEPLATDDPPTFERLIAVAEDVVDHFARERGAALILLRSIVSPPEIEEGDKPERMLALERRIFGTIGGWLDRARRAGVIRNVRVRHALINLLALFLLYPAIAEDDFGRELLDTDPVSPRALRARKEELIAFLRGAFAP